MLAAAKILCASCRRGEPITRRGNETRHGTNPCIAWKIRREIFMA
jgi:hypothetical protein